MATVNFYLKEPNSSVETPIYLAITAGEKRIKFYAHKKILPRFWDAENQRPKKSFVGSPELRSYLHSLAGDAEKVITQFQTMNQPFTLEQIRKRIDEKFERKPKGEIISLIRFIETYIKSVDALRSPLTIRAYRNTLNHLLDFQKRFPKRKVDFESVDLDFYNDFTEYLIREKNFALNTAGKQIKNLKVFLSEATERGFNKKLDFKSRRFKVMAEDSESIYLTIDEIESVFALDLQKDQRLERVRDLFVVGCFTGLRFSDFSQIKPENIRSGLFHIRTQKTDDTVMIPIHTTVQKIMNKYASRFDNCLPPSISNQKMNQYLKEIFRLSGLNEKVLMTINKGGKRVTVSMRKYELVSTHTARRSFATNLYLQGFPAISLMKITGHKTERAFLTYIKISPEENANKLLQFWNSENKLKVV